MSKRNVFIDRNGVNIMFKPKAIYFEKEIENYELGKQLLSKYKDVPKIEIENHNNIEDIRLFSTIYIIRLYCCMYVLLFGV